MLLPMLLALCSAFGTASRKKTPPLTIDAKARAEFALCYRQSIKAMKECAFGGCGNILGACYEKELGVIEADTDAKLLRLQGGKCAEEADSLEGIHLSLKERIGKSRSLESRWNGKDLQVEAALLRNHTLKALLEECGK